MRKGSVQTLLPSMGMLASVDDILGGDPHHHQDLVNEDLVHTREEQRVAFCWAITCSGRLILGDQELLLCF